MFMVFKTFNIKNVETIVCLKSNHFSKLTIYTELLIVISK